MKKIMMKKALFFTIFTLLVFVSYGQWTTVAVDHFDDFPAGFDQHGFGKIGVGGETGGVTDWCAASTNPKTTDYVSKKVTLSKGCRYRFSYIMKRILSQESRVVLKYGKDIGTGGTVVSEEITVPYAITDHGTRFYSNEIIGDGDDYYLKVVVTNDVAWWSGGAGLKIDGFRLEKGESPIESITVTNKGECSDNGTPEDNTDDYYIADVTVAYTGVAPQSGSLNLLGAGVVGGNTFSSTPFSNSSITITDVHLKANSNDVEITAQFGTNSDCPYTETVIGSQLEPCSNAMPINLLSFDAIAENNKVNVNWATAMEENNNYFVIEWSTDGIDFVELEEVNSCGDSRERVEYSYSHIHPVAGYNYYRLVQYDKDGRSEVFDAISVWFEQKEDTKMYISPNIVYNNLKIEFSTPVVNGKLYIYDTQGKLFKTVVLSSNTYFMNLDVSALSAGQYIVEYLDNNKMITHRFLKK